MRAIATATLMAVFLAGTAVSASALPLVVRAAGPAAMHYRPGQKLDAAAVLALKAGDEVTVLSGSGTRRFVGPGRFALATLPIAIDDGFAELLTQAGGRRRPPAMAADSAEPLLQPPGIWPLDAGLSGTVCAIDPAAISLWRADRAVPATLTVMRRGVPTLVGFAMGAAMALLPADVGIVDGDVLTITGQPRPATLTVRLLPRPANLEALGAALVGAGCQPQFERLAAVTLRPDTP